MAGTRAHLDGREVDAVLVDAGGVLVDPNWRLVAEILGRHGVTVDPDALRAADPHAKRRWDDASVIRGSSDLVRRERFLAQILRIVGTDFDADAVDAATDEVEAFHLAHGIWEVVHDGSAEALDRLRGAGLRLALASNAEPLLRDKLTQLGLAQRFDHLTISGELGIEKPDPRFFRSALGALGVPTEHAVHVGDFYEIDVVGARAAGLQAVLVDVAGLSADRDVTRIRSLAELPALLGIR